MIKGSSLVAMISLPDIFQNAKIVGGREQNYMTVYIFGGHYLLDYLFAFRTRTTIFRKENGTLIENSTENCVRAVLFFLYNR